MRPEIVRALTEGSNNKAAERANARTAWFFQHLIGMPPLNIPER